MDILTRATAAAAFLRSRITALPTIGLVLGSGLGDYADTLEDAVTIPYSEIPHFPVPTVAAKAVHSAWKGEIVPFSLR